MLSPRAIKRSLTCRSPPRYAAPAGDLLSNRPGRCENLQPPGSPEKHGRAASQAIAATQLMHLGQENGLREPEPGYETQAARRVPRPGRGQPPLRTGTRRGARGRIPRAPRMRRAVRTRSGSADTVRPARGAAGRGQAMEALGKTPATFPRGGSGGCARGERRQNPSFFIHVCVSVYV